MKRMTSFLVFFLLASSLVAQEEETIKKKELGHEIGVNATFLIKQFFDFGNSQSNFTLSPYALTYKLVSNGGKHAFRTGFGGSYERVVEDLENVGAVRTLNDLVLNYRVGYEYRIPFGKGFISTFGFDFLGFNTNSKVVAISAIGTTTTTSDINGLGLGPMMGIEYCFKGKVSLATELNMAYTHSNNKSSTIIEGTVTSSESTSRQSDSFRLDLPASLFIVIKF